MKKMKKILIVLAASGLMASCGSKDCEKSCHAEGKEGEKMAAIMQEETEVYKRGEEVNASEAITLSDLASQLKEQDSAVVTVKGEISEVCSKKGCWMTLPMGDGEDLFVKFKDYEFFVPLDCSGKTTTIKGIAKKEVQSVEEQKHYAEDAGQSEEEIAKITEPKTTYSFMASGVEVL